MIRTLKSAITDVDGFIRYAQTKDEATHKYPTSVHWGDGHFGGMRHLVCNSSIAAYNVMKLSRHDCDWENLWRREAGKWINCKDLRE